MSVIRVKHVKTAILLPIVANIVASIAANTVVNIVVNIADRLLIQGNLYGKN